MPRWKRILILLAVAVTVGVLVWQLPPLFGPDHCAPGVQKRHGECIGVNADGYDFGNPEIKDVARAIAAQNKEIGGQPSVTVAMMLPLQSDDPALRRQMRSDLQGAYLGQRQVNQAKGEPPKIRLALANPGRDYAQQAEVVDALLKMAHSSDHPLRAVTGFNLSLKSTTQAIKQLTEHHVPVLASRLSGDGSTNEDRPDGTTAKLKFPGLARIIPSNHDAAQALAGFNNSQARQNRKTVVVYDERPNDGYNESLTRAFNSIREKGPPGPAAMSFESPDVDKAGSTGNQFNTIANNICDTGADTVYFAGRTLHLRLFALRLAQQPCRDRHYTIISGSDAASLRQGMSSRDWSVLRGPGGRPKVTVQYAAPAHPDAWRDTLAAWDSAWRAEHHTEPTDRDRPGYLTEPRDALAVLQNQIAATRREGVPLGSRPDLEDSRTMLVYDGLVTIGTALHEVQGSDPSGVPDLRTIGQQWGKLQSRHRVHGTSGWVCLTNGGNPYDKPVAVVELDPVRGGGKLKFVGLGWPTGRPQPDNCVIPSRS